MTGETLLRAEIRPATDADGAGLARLIAGVFTEYPGCLFVRDEMPELTALATHYAQKGGIVWVVEKERDIVGSLAVAPTPERDACELFKLYLAAHVRGRGLARALLERAERFARDHGARRLKLWTDTRFRDGHRFYERNGFRRLPTRRFLADASCSWEYPYVRDIDGDCDAR